MKRVIKTTVILIVGLFISYRLINQVDHSFMFDDVINFVLITIVVGVFIWTVIGDRKHYIKAQHWTAFIPTITGLIVTLGLLTTLWLLNQRDKSPVKFSIVSKIVDFNGVSIDFREDGTYKLCNFCLGADYYRGRYILNDSIITLDTSSIDKVIESNRLVIRADGRDDDNGNTEKSIYQVDKKGKVIDNAVDYRLIAKHN